MKPRLQPARAPASAEAHDLPYVNDFGDLRSLQFNGLTVQSMMSMSYPHLLALDYTRAMMGFLLFCPQPASILMIGLGGGSLAKYCLYALAGTRFTAVEINPEVIALREQFAIPPDDEHFRIICADGAAYLRTLEAPVDVLLVDGFNACGLPAELSSIDFYADCERALSPQGVMSINLWAGDPRYPVYIARLREAFAGRVLSIPAEEGDNRISFALGRAARFPTRKQLLDRTAALERVHSFDVTDISRRVIARLEARAQR